MSDQSKENGENSKRVRVLVALDVDTHERVLSYQAKATGRKGRFVTVADACADIIERATKRIKISQ
jgi:hypothetical protein